MDKFLKSLFWILIFLSLFLAIKSIKTNFYNFNIRSFGRVIEPICVNLEFDKLPQKTPFACFNSNCKQYSINPGNIYFAKCNILDEFYLKGIVKNTLLFFENENDIKNLQNIYAYSGETNYYFSKDDISKFQSSKIKINDKTYNVLRLPLKSNFRGILNAFSISFLALFYNWKYFIFPYFLLFLAGLIKIFENKDLNIKINYFAILCAITFLGVLLRCAQFNYYPLWIDEIYCKTIALESFKTCFLDPGNPPLFFLLEKISTSILSKSNIGLRALPFAFGVMTIPLLYFFIKKNTKEDILAIFCAFFMSVNVFSIYLSQETKSTSMCMVLVILAIHFLIKYLENPNNKNMILYLIFSFLLINSHYYLLIFAFSNLIYIGFNLYKNKNYSHLKKFLVLNLLLFLTFLPYFLNVSSIALDNNFNTWIEKFNLKVMYDAIQSYFCSLKGLVLYIMLIFAQFILYKNAEKLNLKTDENKIKLLKYLIYSIVFAVFSVVIISIFIKPIFNRRIFMSLYALLFLLDMILFMTILKVQKLNLKQKLLKFIYQVFVVLFLFSITNAIHERGTFSFDYLLHFITCDPVQKQYRYYAVVEGGKTYIKDYQTGKNINWIETDINKTRHEFNINSYLNFEPVIIYLRYAALYKYKGRKDTVIKIYETNNRNIAKIIYK